MMVDNNCSSLCLYLIFFEEPLGTLVCVPQATSSLLQSKITFLHLDYVNFSRMQNYMTTILLGIKP